jgi:hypothetical protein
MRQRGQREEDECNNQIEVEYVGGKWTVVNTTRGGGRGREAGGWQKTQQEEEEGTTQDKRVVDDARRWVWRTQRKAIGWPPTQ